MTRTTLRLSTLCLCLSLSGLATAHTRTPACEALQGERRAAMQALFATLHPYDGCDDTFERCLAAEQPHPLVVRLASDICRLLRDGRTEPQVVRAFSLRARTMLPGAAAASFELDEATAAGDTDAPVQVVVYACARCPFCSRLVRALHREVTEGALAGKVRLYFRPFPLKGHPGSVEGGLAMISAARNDAFWPFVLRMYERYDAFCPQALPDWAAESGVDRAAFEATYADPATRAALVASKQEGLRNGVDATPTLFVDGRKYLYELRIEAVTDVLEEAYDAAAGKSRHAQAGASPPQP